MSVSRQYQMIIPAKQVNINIDHNNIMLQLTIRSNKSSVYSGITSLHYDFWRHDICLYLAEMHVMENSKLLMKCILKCFIGISNNGEIGAGDISSLEESELIKARVEAHNQHPDECLPAMQLTIHKNKPMIKLNDRSC